MTGKILRAISACALLFIAAPASSQPHHTLTVEDFRGMPHINNRGVVAYTNCTIDFRYQPIHDKGNYRLNFQVRMNMNTDRSWIDRSRIKSSQVLAEILKHEQGHYTIAWLEQQEVIRAMQRTRFTANYRAEAMALFDRVDAKYRQLNIDYDEDTQHSVNRQQQHSWDVYFAKRLEFMPRENAGL